MHGHRKKHRRNDIRDLAAIGAFVAVMVVSTIMAFSIVLAIEIH
jgi:hypothetical protein